MGLVSQEAGVDANGVRLPEGCEAVVDVLFDGRRIWSLAPETGRRAAKKIGWPTVLLPYLDGRADVEVRDHVSGEVLLSQTVDFGDSTGPIRVVDGQGRPLAVTKWGKLNHPFDATDRSAIEGYLDQVEEVLAVLTDECHVPSFLSYGSLLGAVREGGLIGHDVDVDLGYLSAHTHPADVLLESYAIERRLRAHDWRVRRENGGFLALFLPQSDGTTRNLDVFTCFQVDDHIHQVHDTRVKADRTVVEPVAPVTFEGRQLPGPAQPDVMLETAYGKGWRVPDPAFEFHTPRQTRRRIGGWLGGIRDERDRWNDFYRGRRDEIPTEVSDFAQWARDRWGAAAQPPQQVIDLGCGNGRDSVYFADDGTHVVGADFSAVGLRQARAHAKATMASVDFVEWNLNSLRETFARAARLAHDPGPRVVYARMLVDALPEHARPQFWQATRMLLAGGGQCFLEFRTESDRSTRKKFGRHYRRFLNPDLVAAEAARIGARVVERVEGRGLAVLDHENPHMCRLVLEVTR
jgi:SAM-dependent methyltransferase